ncbi:MAG: serine/threonine protein kinase [Planctomycetes bacterium]|nr:serine/threonine protein kinase [Planctomycetota bacterium]
MSDAKIDRRGLDTELALTLERQARLDLPTLRGTLAEVRQGRGDGGPTLARLLVGRGVLGAAEANQLLADLPPSAAPDEPGELAVLEGWARQLRGDATWAGRSPASEEALVGAVDDDLETRLVSRKGAVGRDTLPAAPPQSDEPAGWVPGARIGEHVLEGPLGVGGMGIVYRARHLPTGEARAIKTLRGSPDQELLERFRREAEAQARVDGHENVARALGTGEAHGRPYLVMELVEGGDLDDLLEAGRLGLEEKVRVLAGVARGLAHLHARGVLHRDLKPPNILFDGARTVKLADFGLARVQGQAPITAPGEVMGTPAYMAPEQMAGDPALVGPCTDVWALGVVMFFTFSGQTPFAGGTPVEVIERVATQAPPPLRAVCPDVSPEIEAICAACLQRPREARPSAAAVAEALETFARALATDAATARRAVLARRVAAAVVALLVVGALLVAAALAAGRGADQAM